jgi:hypothetical protein
LASLRRQTIVDRHHAAGVSCWLSGDKRFFFITKAGVQQLYFVIN